MSSHYGSGGRLRHDLRVHREQIEWRSSTIGLKPGFANPLYASRLSPARKLYTTSQTPQPALLSQDNN